MAQEEKIINQCEKCPVRHRSAFKDLKFSDCELIDSVRTVKTFSANESISITAEDSQYFYCVQQGHLKLGTEGTLDKGIIRICGPGDLVGYDTSTFHRNIQFLEKGKICFIQRSEFIKLQNSAPEVSEAIIHALIKIIKIKDERIIGLENHSVKNRVASALFSVAKKFGIQTQNGLQIEAKIDRKALANLAGTVVESLARVLTDLESEKIILRRGRTIFILNMEMLRKFTL